MPRCLVALLQGVTRALDSLRGGAFTRVVDAGAALQILDDVPDSAQARNGGTLFQLRHSPSARRCRVSHEALEILVREVVPFVHEAGIVDLLQDVGGTYRERLDPIMV